MWDGKKSVSEIVFYETLEILGARTKEDPLMVFTKGFDNIKPSLEVRSRRIGGATYQVPQEVRPDRREMLARRGIINAARDRCGAHHERTPGRRDPGCVQQQGNIH